MKKNKKIILGLITIVLVCLIALGVTYAYWILTRQQTGKNVVSTACLKIDFEGKNDITLDKAYPMEPDELESFLSTATPYHFTITNKCDSLQNAVINLETLTGLENELEDDYIDTILYEEDYNLKLNKSLKLTENTINDSNKVIKDAKHAYALYSFILKNGETRDFNLQLYLDKDTPMNENTMNASWKGKITLSTEYMEDTNVIREIKGSNEGMWKYKEKLTQIVIEDSKSEKEASDGGAVYGPFAESIYSTNGVQSYVVCDENETSCIGYLQGDKGVKLNQNSSNLFSGFSNVTDITGLENLDTSDVVNMNNMFGNMRNLSSIDLTSFNTSKVSNMMGMFNYCSSLTKLDLSSFDMQNVVSVSGMFGGTTELTELNLNNWKFSNSIASSFSNMTGLSSSRLNSIFLENVDTSSVTSMSSMFANLNNLQELDLSNFDTSHVTSMNGIFQNMGNLTTLNLSNWNLNSLYSSSKPSLFKDNNNLSSITMINAIFPINSSSLFSDLTNLTNINLDNINTSAVTNMSYMFQNCSNMLELNLSSFDTTNLKDITYMFENMEKLQTLNVSNWTFNDSIAQNFSALSGLTSTDLNTITLDNVNTSEVTNMSLMFTGLRKVLELDLSDFDTSNVITFGCFGENTNLQTLNLSNWTLNDSIVGNFYGNISNLILDNVKTSKLTNMSGMFADLPNIHTLDLSSFDTSNVTNMTFLFQNSKNIEELDISNWTLPSGSSTIFSNLEKLNKIVLNNVDTSKATTFLGLFSGCSSLTSLDLSSFDTRNVTDFRAMFSNTTNLQTIKFGSNFIRSADAFVTDMFNGCSAPERPSDSSWQGVSFS